MTSVVCLQGGAELTPGCEPIDLAVLDAVAGEGGDLQRVRVLVGAFAAVQGADRSGATERARRWYRRLGVAQVRGCDTTDALADALAPAGEGTLLVLPGGSPSRLLDDVGPLRAEIVAFLGRGGSLSGASAGAMVACRWTVLPDRRRGGGPGIAEGLGCAGVDLVVPHYRHGGAVGWVSAATDRLDDDALVLGLPERCGVVLRRGGADVSATWPDAVRGPLPTVRLDRHGEELAGR